VFQFGRRGKMAMDGRGVEGAAVEERFGRKGAAKRCWGGRKKNTQAGGQTLGACWDGKKNKVRGKGEAIWKKVCRGGVLTLGRPIR